MKSERTGTPQPGQERDKQISAWDAADLRRAQELRRVLGDPRVRVQVPTESDGEPPPTPAAKRYQTG